MIDIKVRGQRTGRDGGFSAIRQRILAKLDPLTEQASEAVIKHARDAMSAPKTGIHHEGLPNRSSARGEAPATQSGDLARSLRSLPLASRGSHRRIGTHLWYGKKLMLEMDRPLLIPALRKVQPGYMADIRRLIARSM